MDRKNTVVVATEELFFEDFDGNSSAGISNAAAEVDLGGVALAERLDDLVLVVENGVLLV